MDAHAHLLSLGWAGPGHSLDSRPHMHHKGRRGLAYDPSQNNNTGRGLVKPLLVSQKRNSFGIGKKIHEPAGGNEWWLKGFENALSNVGKKGGSQTTSGTATPETGPASGYRGKHDGLYGFFLKGQQMEGTIGEEASKRLRGRKRKSDTFDDEEDASTDFATTTQETPTSHQTTKSDSKAAADFEQVSQSLGVRDKDRKCGDRRAKVDSAQEFEQMGHLFDAGSGRRKKKSSRKAKDFDASDSLGEADPACGKKRGLGERKADTKYAPIPSNPSEEKQRRQERTAAKAATSLSYVEKEIAQSSSNRSSEIAGSPADSPAPIDEALRRAERKRRKQQKRLAMS